MDNPGTQVAIKALPISCPDLWDSIRVMGKAHRVHRLKGEDGDFEAVD